MIARLSSCCDFDVADWHLMGQLLGLNGATIVFMKNQSHEWIRRERETSTTFLNGAKFIYNHLSAFLVLIG